MISFVGFEIELNQVKDKRKHHTSCVLHVILSLTPICEHEQISILIMLLLLFHVEQLADLSCLVYQKSTNTYAPYNKEWIKEKIYVLLRQAAGTTDEPSGSSAH